MLDLFLSTQPIQGLCETIYLDISDHHAILAHAVLPTGKPKQSSRTFSARPIHRVNWNLFNADLTTRIHSVALDAQVDELANALSDSILQTLDHHAPMVVRRKRLRRPCPWLTGELVAAVRERNALHRRLMKDPGNAALKDQHRSARAAARKLDRKLRNMYFLSQCATSDQRKLWQVMNTVTGRKRVHQAPQAPLNDLSMAFGNVVTDNARPAQLAAPGGPVPENNFSAFQPVMVQEVEKCLRAVDPAKATGSDLVPGIVLKSCSAVLAPVVCKIINVSLAHGEVPSSYKHSHISPLYKSGDKSVARNYRPVSLLPILSRILEYFVKKQVSTYLDTYNLLPATQFAYRKNHSTEDALALAVNRWQMAKTERKHTGIAFIDMSKAFDRVQHPRLISELFSLGISGTPLQWFCSYLSGRSQQVKVEGELSASVPCSRGVPQGSVLGPLLFVLYTRHIASVLPPQVIDQEFADDIIIEFSHSDLPQVCSTLTTAVTNVQHWLSDIGLLMNTGKTQVMIVQPRGSQLDPPSIKCGTETLTITSTAKYLGVVVDNELSWTHHLDHVTRKAAQTIGQLWRHGRCLSMAARRSWYVAMILSHLTYASNAFFPALSQQRLDRLVKISKAGLRAIFHLPPHTPTAPLLSRLKLQPFLNLLKQKIVIFVHRCLASSTSSLFANYFHRLDAVLPVAGRQTRGQVSRSLQVPFLRGPAGRASLQFMGAVYWNALPASVRTVTQRSTFKNLLSNDILQALSTNM